MIGKAEDPVPRLILNRRNEFLTDDVENNDISTVPKWLRRAEMKQAILQRSTTVIENVTTSTERSVQVKKKAPEKPCIRETNRKHPRFLLGGAIKCHSRRKFLHYL